MWTRRGASVVGSAAGHVPSTFHRFCRVLKYLRLCPVDRCSQTASRCPSMWRSNAISAARCPKARRALPPALCAVCMRNSRDWGLCSGNAVVRIPGYPRAIESCASCSPCAAAASDCPETAPIGTDKGVHAIICMGKRKAVTWETTGAPAGIRTQNRRIRSPVLYPVGLRAHALRERGNGRLSGRFADADRRSTTGNCKRSRS
jgi:hypothetical protein